MPTGFLPFYNYNFKQNHTNCTCFSYTPFKKCLPRETSIFLNESQALLRQYLYYPLCTNNMDDVRHGASDALYGVPSRSQCSLMLLTNLAEPNIININCEYKLLPYAACVKFGIQHVKANNYSEKMKHCPAGALLLGNKCWLFQWVKSQSQLHKRKMRGQNSRNKTGLVGLDIFQILSKSVQSQIPSLSVESPNLPYQVIEFSCRKLHCKLTCKSKLLPKISVPGFVVKFVHFSAPFTGGSTFECEYGVHVNVMLRCDREVDCLDDRSDEDECFCSTDASLRNKTFSDFLFFVSIKGQCVLFGSRPNHSTYGVEHGKVTCELSPIYLKNDLVVDCSITEEQDLVKLLSGYPTYCKSPQELPCQEGHSKCFNLTDICMFHFDIYNHIHPCRNGGHLENCLHFECSRTFKCTHSYCIPWTYVCDGKVDCPIHDDENVFALCQNSKVKCANKYKCLKTLMCILLISICDGIPDCPLKDDEFLCQLRHLTCPPSCNCLALAIKCSKHRGSLKVYPFLSIFLLNSPTVHSYSKKFQQTMFLWIQQSNISVVADISFPETLLFLDMSNNILCSIPGESFHQNPKLRSLILGNNKITFLAKDTFLFLSHLTIIILSNNPIKEFSAQNFPSTIKLISLFGTFCNITDVSMFKIMMSEVVLASDYHICCFASPTIHCTAQMPWYRSCGDLLEDMVSKAGSYGFSAFLVVTNFMSVCVHIWKRKTFSKAYQAAIVTVHTHSLSLVTFFIILWANDLVLEGRYAGYDYLWKRVFTCFTLAGIHLEFVFSSCLLSTFVSFCRLMVVVHPITTQFKRTKPVSKFLFIISLLSFISSACTMILFHIIYSELPVKLCTIFHDPTKEFVAVKVAIWGSFCMHVFLLAVISLMHAGIHYKFMESQHKITSTTKQNHESGLQLQLALITALIFVSWVSFNITILTTLYLPSYPMALVSRAFVFVQPLYPSLYPVILSCFVLKSAVKEKLYHK